jgi:hypothetical protein
VAFLAVIPVPVLNRPAENYSYLLNSSLHLRTLARRLGIPTIEETLLKSNRLWKNRPPDPPCACQDLSSELPFWLDAESPIDPGHQYARMDHFACDLYILDACICGEMRSFFLRPDRTLQPAETNVAKITQPLSARLLGALGLDFAFCVYSLHRERQPKFTRLSISSLPVFSSDIAEWAASRLAARLMEG